MTNGRSMIWSFISLANGPLLNSICALIKAMIMKMSMPLYSQKVTSLISNTADAEVNHPILALSQVKPCSRPDAGGLNEELVGWPEDGAYVPAGGKRQETGSLSWR